MASLTRIMGQLGGNEIMVVPLTELIPIELLPTDQITSEESPLSILERILVTSFETRQLDPGPGDEITVGLMVAEEVALNFPGLDGVALLLGGGDRTALEVSARVVPDSIEVRISGGARLRFSRELLRPVVQHDGKWIDDPSRAYSEIDINTAIIIDQDWTIAFGGPNEFALEASMIADSGCVIEGTVAIDLSESQSIPETIAMGLGDTWRGLILKTLMFHLPDDLDVTFLPDDLTFTNFCIGSGGISGSVSGNWTPQLNAEKTAFIGNGAGVLFDIPFALREVAIEFKQNTLVESKIEGALIFPFFDQPIFCEIRLTNEGNFTVAVSADQTLPPGIPQPEQADDGLFVFTKEDLLELKLKSIAFEKRDEAFFIKLGGDIKPLLGGLTWPSFEVKELSIDSRGRVTIDGGWIDLPKQLTMDFYGFALEVSKLGFGTEDDGSRWIGFSGGLKLCEGLPMSGAVEGLRIYWKGSDFWLEFTGVELAFEIPNSIEFAGRVEFINDPDGPKRGFKGGGKVKIIPTGLEINAELVIGKNEKDPAYTFFYIFLDAQLPAGIPLGQTGAAFYGIAGLFAYNMEPNKRPELEWYEGWYKDDPIGVSSSLKWDDARGRFALGAGITLGTATDNGYAVSAKSLLVLVLPGPILVLEGKGTFLQDRSKISEEPPFRALSVLDARAGQFLMNMEAQYPTPSDSLVRLLLQVNAGAEAFFDFNNPNNWHLFVGQRAREKRVRALVYNLYEGNAYLMLYPTQFEAGAQVGYNAQWTFGPLGVVLQALIEGGLLVSWKPVQIKGQIGLIGQLALRAFGASLGLALSAALEVEAPTPYRVFAEFDAKMKLPWPLPDPEAHIELEWREAIPPPTPIPLSTVGIEHLKVSEKWLLGRSPNYDVNDDGLWYGGQPGPSTADADSPIVPLDAKLVLSFARPMVDAALVGVNPSGIVAPERVGDYEFQYRLVEVTLEKRAKTSSAGWEIVAGRRSDDPDLDKEKLWGTWLAVNGETSSSAASEMTPMTKLMLFAKSPFEYARETIDDTYYDQFSEWNPTYGICVVNPPRKECFGFDDLVEEETKEQRFRELRRGDVIIIGDNMRVGSDATDGENSYIEIGYHTMRATAVVFPENIMQVELLVGGNTRAVAHLYDGTHKVGQWDIKNDRSDSALISFPEKLSENFNLIVINGLVRLFGMCYMTAREADRYLEEKETAAHVSQAGDVYEYPVETGLLSPHSYYRVKIVTEALRRQIGQGDFEVVKRFEEYSYFQTEDPPGIYVPSNEGEMTPTGEDEHYPKRGPLKDLSPYISKVTPTEGAQAVYRSYDVGAEFNEPYVEHMYMLTGKPLSIYLYDNNGQGIQTPKQDIAAIGSSWKINDKQFYRRADLEWESTVAQTQAVVSAMVTSAGGIDAAEDAGHPAAFSGVPSVRVEQAPKQNGIWGGGEDMVLKPQTLYRATIVAIEPRIVVPLRTDGNPIRINNNLQYARIAADGSNFVSAIEDTFGQSELGVKIVSDGRRTIVTDMRASDTAQPVSIDRQLIDTVVKEALVNVTPKPESRPVFSWSFITSRFTSFVHHIHSFVDAGWNLRATLGLAAWPEELTQERQNALNGLKALIEDAHSKRDDIFQKTVDLFKLEDRPLPEQIEINVLEDANGRYGFMIESPEPIQWRIDRKGRVTLEKVQRSDNMIAPSMPAYGPVKFIDCDLQADWVEILVQTDLDLSGYKIERIYSSTPPDTYYRFDEGSRFRAGTIIRIHSGFPPPAPQPIQERKNLYVGPSASILGNAGEILRISDQEGREIHRRQFAPSDYETFTSFVIAPNADGTRTFLFLLNNSGVWINQIPDGVFRFYWHFLRDAGPDLPVLRRSGSTTPEKTFIEFNVPAELA